MNNIELKDLVGGALQEKFNKSFENVIENLQDQNTPFKLKRGITIKLSFEQNETRDDVTVSIDVSEKLAPQAGMKTSFSIGKDLRTGELFAEEYGRQVKGQMNINDYVVEKVDGQVVDTSTGEIIGDNTGNKVLDFRKVQSL
mgnify:CR=1 FL=1